MSLIDDVIIRIQAIGGKEAAADVGEVEGGLKGLGETAKTAAGIAGIAGVAFGLRDVTRAAIAFQAQQHLLANSLHNTGQYSHGAVKQLTDAADTLAQSGGYDPSTSIQGMQQLITAHEGVAEAIKNETLVTDISRSSKVSYTTALRDVMMAEEGHVTGLTRLGITMQTATDHQTALTTKIEEENEARVRQVTAIKGSTAAQIANAAHTYAATTAQKEQAYQLDQNENKLRIMPTLWARFGNAAKAYSDTAAGGASNFSNSVDILGQRVGTFLLPMIQKLLGGLSAAMKWLNDNQKAVVALAIAFGVLGAVWGVEKLAQFVLWLSRSVVVTRAATAAQWLYNAAWTVFDALTDAAAAGLVAVGIAGAPIEVVMGLVVVAILAVAAAVYLLVTHLHTVEDVAKTVFHAIESVVKTAVDFIGEHWKLLLLIIAPLLGLIVDTVVTHFAAIKKFVGDVLSAIGGFFVTVGQGADDVWNWIYKNVITPIGQLIQVLVQDQVERLVSIWHKISGPIHAIWHGIYKVVRTVVGAIVNAVEWAVGKIAKLWHHVTGPINSILHGIGSVGGSVGHFLGIGGKSQGGPISQTGPYMVGENGPELVSLPAGANVTPNGFARGASNSGDGTPLHNEITIQVSKQTVAKVMAQSMALAKATS